MRRESRGHTARHRGGGEAIRPDSEDTSAHARTRTRTHHEKSVVGTAGSASHCAPAPVRALSRLPARRPVRPRDPSRSSVCRPVGRCDLETPRGRPCRLCSCLRATRADIRGNARVPRIQGGHSWESCPPCMTRRPFPGPGYYPTHRLCDQFVRVQLPDPCVLLFTPARVRASTNLP